MSIVEEEYAIESTRFSLLERLGEGGMGVVYSAHDKELDITVALKTLKERDSETLLRLKKEFRSLHGLQHPNIISFGELFEDRGKWFFTMEYVRGQDFLSHVRVEHSLRDLNRRSLAGEPEVLDDASPIPDSGQGGHRFDENRLREGLAQLVNGLMALHDAGRLHRDIKPDNILVEASGRVVLMDFGLVTESEQNLKTMSRFFPVGTSSYMSPEQAASANLTVASDWYSVGVLLFHALTGRLPFEGNFSTVVLEKQRSAAPSPNTYNPAAPPDLCQLCEDLLRFEPGRRPRGEEILERLKGGNPAPRIATQPSVSCEGPFIGRTEELDRLQACFDSVLQRVPQVVLLNGPSGLGKTGLARHFLTQVSESGDQVLVLSGRCNEQESVSFKAFDQVMDALSQVLLRLPEEDLFYVIPKNGILLTRIFPVLSRVKVLSYSTQLRQNTENLQEFRSAAFGALRDLFMRLADRYTVCLFIDNYQWADEDSHKLLATLTQPPAPPNLFWLLGLRTPSNTEQARRLVTETLDLMPTEVTDLPLEPLDEQEAVQLAERLCRFLPDQMEVPADTIAQIARESGGHPLFIQELVRYVSSRHSAAETEEIPNLERALWARMDALDETQQLCMEYICLAAAPLPLKVLSRILGLSPGQLLRSLQQLQIAHFVRSTSQTGERLYEPFHDRVRSTVAGHLSEAVIKDRNHDLAYAFKSLSNTKPETLAHHFAAAGEVQEAINYYSTAAHLANENLAFRRAAELFRRALALWSEPDRVKDPAYRQHRLLLAQSLANAGQGKEAAEVILNTLEGAKAAEALELQQRAGTLLLRAGYLDDGVRVLHELLSSVNIRLPRHGWRTLLTLLWRRLRLRLRGLKFRERDETEISMAELARIDLLKAVSTSSDNIIRCSAFATQWVIEALDLGEPSRILHALILEANYLSASGASPRGPLGKVLGVISSILAKHDKSEFNGYYIGALAYGSYMRGEFRSSHQYAVEALDYIRLGKENFWEQAHMHFVILWSLFYLGEVKEMTRIGMGFFNDSMARGDVWGASGGLLGLSTLPFLNMEGAQRSRERTGAFMERWTKNGYQLQQYWHWLSEMQFELFSDDVQAAQRRLESEWGRIKKSLLLMVPAVQTEAFYLRALVALKQAADPRNGSSRSKLIKAAQKDGRRLIRNKNPWTRGFGEIILASASLQSRDDDAAIAGLMDCRAALARYDMHLHEACLTHRLGALMGGDEGAALTAEAEAFFTRQEIRDPDALTRMLIP